MKSNDIVNVLAKEGHKMLSFNVGAVPMKPRRISPDTSKERNNGIYS